MSAVTKEQIERLTEEKWRRGSAMVAALEGTRLYREACKHVLSMRDQDTEADLMAGRQASVFTRWADLREVAKANAPDDLSAIRFINNEPYPPAGPPLSMIGYAFLAQEYADNLTDEEREVLTRAWKATQTP